MSPKKQTRMPPRQVWRYSHADYDALAVLLDDLDWDTILINDVNSSWTRWKNSFLYAVGRCIPKVTIKSEKRVPWVTHAIKQAMRKRGALFRKAKCSGCSADYQLYKHHRNRVLSMLRDSRQSFFNNLDAANSKEFWKAVRKLGTSKNSAIPSISDGNTLAESNQAKAIMLNNFFYSCFNRSCPPLSDGSSVFQSTQTDLDPSNFPVHLQCDSDCVAEMLLSLDLSKSSGPDGISPQMLRSTAYSIAPSLAKLFNSSLAEEVFPQDWKLARVVPVPKNADLKNSVSGYRPISTLSTISKLLEQHVKNLILDHICNTYPVSDHQWGFMHHRSSISALISVIYDWLYALDNGLEVCVVFFDVQKAFNSVPHLPLLQKLEEIGINQFILKWVQSYLTERKQYVAVEGSSSNILQVLSGVPQGSVLGPLLFIIYLNDVVSCISAVSKINLFADDIALYRVINSPDNYADLQADIDAVNTCLNAKYLTLNPRKCCHMFLSRKRSLSNSPPCLTLGNSALTCVTSYKYLGVLITSDLTWSAHISKICIKTRKLIGLLYRRFHKYSSSDTLLKLYVSFIRPHLEYAAASWDLFLKKDIELIEDVQKFALRVCLKSWSATYTELLEQSNLPSLQTRRQHAKLCHLFKIINEATFFP